MDKADAAADWRVLLASEPLHYQGTLLDESNPSPGKTKLQVHCPGHHPESACTSGLASNATSAKHVQQLAGAGWSCWA